MNKPKIKFKLALAIKSGEKMKPIYYILGTAALIATTAAATIGLYKLNESRKPQYIKTVEVNGAKQTYFVSNTDSLDGKPFAVKTEDISNFYENVMEAGKKAYHDVKQGQSAVGSIDEKVK